MKTLTILLLALFLFMGCGPTMQYMGKTYSATSDVDVFYSKDDIAEEYEVMGQAEAMGDGYISVNGIYELIMKEAKSKGADAIIIGGVETEHTSQGYYSKNPFMIVGSVKKKINVLFIKYK